jgi:23S rRNA pseudouridine1911/1915/1917 synthase
MIEHKKISVNKGGVRLDAALLSYFPSSTRSFIREAIASGDIQVNGRAALKGVKLKGGEEIFVKRLLEAQDNLVRPVSNPSIKAIFEDSDLLAFDKPAGMSVQPLSCTETGTLMNAVAAKYPECRALGDRPLMSGALHRIDTNTSGLVLVARNAATFNSMREQFANQSVRKTYLALVEGSVATGGILENDLVHDPTLPYCKMIDINSRNAPRSPQRIFHAVTKYSPIQHYTVECEERTLLKVEIYTGVTHQIRAQLAIAHMHIINDRLYGAFAVEDMQGHALHALSAAFRHPSSGDETEIQTAFPYWAK